MVNKIATGDVARSAASGRRRGACTASHLQMDLQAESIASLKGAAAEPGTCASSARCIDTISGATVSYWRFGIVNVFFVGHWGVTDVVMSAFCIGRGIVSPQVHYSPEDSPR